MLCECFHQSFHRIIGLEPMHGIGPSDENKPIGTNEYLSFLGPLCAISSTVAEAVFPLIVFDLLNTNRWLIFILFLFLLLLIFFVLFNTLVYFTFLYLTSLFVLVRSTVLFIFIQLPSLRVHRYRRDYPANDLLSERIAVCLLSPYNTLFQAGQLACYTLQILLREDINRFVYDTTPPAGKMVNSLIYHKIFSSRKFF